MAENDARLSHSRSSARNDKLLPHRADVKSTRERLADLTDMEKTHQPGANYHPPTPTAKMTTESSMDVKF